MENQTADLIQGGLWFLRAEAAVASALTRRSCSQGLREAAGFVLWAQTEDKTRKEILTRNDRGTFFFFFAWQTRTPRVTRLSPPQPALADQANRVSFASTENLEAMSEPDIPVGFNRMNRLRQSLPLTRSSSHAKLRAPGQTPPPPRARRASIQKPSPHASL